jgi:hypothetical protein
VAVLFASAASLLSLYAPDRLRKTSSEFYCELIWSVSG